MAWATSILKKYVFGHRRVHAGSWNSAGATGGDITTGLKRVEMCVICHSGNTVVSSGPATIDETFPLASGSVTVAATSGDTGYWLAIGL